MKYFVIILLISASSCFSLQFNFDGWTTVFDCKDIDNDNNMDIVIGSHVDGEIFPATTIMRNDGECSFSFEYIYHPCGFGRSNNRNFLQDVDNNNFVDIVSVSATDTQIVLRVDYNDNGFFNYFTTCIPDSTFMPTGRAFSFGDWDDPYDFFQFMRDESHQGWIGSSSPNDDGYGVIYYPADGSMYFDDTDYFNTQNQAWYKTSRDIYGNWHYPPAGWTWYGDPNPHWGWDDDEIPPFVEPIDDIIEPKIMINNTEASIVLGHDRQGTGGNGNHPFRLQIETNGKHYTFEHNGYFNISEIKLKFYNRTNSLHQGWFYEEGHESNWDGEPGSVTNWIDSELYFHYILANIEHANGDVIQGIYDALSYDLNPDPHIEDILIGSNERSNFILSDGFTVYAYRGTNIADYDLKYVENDTFWGITSGTESGTQLGQDYLAIFSPYGDIETIDLADPPEFKSGTIAQSTTWDSNILITDDITILVGVTLNIDAEATFVSHSTFTINGTVNLQDDSNLKINHSSEVLVENNGLLFLNWGSTLKGYTPTTYGATPPGQPSGGEEVIPGDRIIAQNGGIITTDIPDHFTQGDPVVSISSSSGELWNGIYIENPPADSTYWFVNCDISSICDLVMKGVTREPASLKLYKTNFHDNAQLMIRDGQELFIEGTLGDSCYIENNAFGIVTYNSPVYIDYASITGNGTGISMNYACVDLSSVTNSNISDNNGSGIIIRDRDVNLIYNKINNNTRNGIISYKGTELPSFLSNTLKNNGWSEYAGYVRSYDNWYDGDNAIDDEDYSYTIDKYILKAFDWQLGDERIDLRGNPEINHSDTTRFYPYYVAFEFDDGEIPPEREMLNAGMDAMKAGDYSTARTTLEQLITIYPETIEAASALQGIYFIENYTDRDFNTLLNYIYAINTPENSFLQKAKKDITIKVFILQEDYITAIDSLELVIANPSSTAEEVDALIDEGYCYVKLIEQGSRTLPVYCTITPSNFYELHEIVRELEARLFEGEEIEPDVDGIIPACITLTNYPNPFNPTTTINFSLPEDSNVELSIYNVKGQKVKQLISNSANQLSAGQNSVVWNGKDSNNKSVSSGIYFYKLSSGKETKVKKMLLLK